MDSPDDLSVFLERLREAGVPVGIKELDWLRRIFLLRPTLDRQGLHDVLCCTLIKTPQQRDLFDDLFDVWCPEDFDSPDDDLAPDEADLQPEDDPSETPLLQVDQDDTRSSFTPRDRPPVADQPLRHILPALSRWPWATPVRLTVAVLALAAVSVLGVLLVQFATARLTPVSSGTGARLLLGSIIWLSMYGIWHVYRRSAPPGAVPFDSSGPAWQPLPHLLPGGVELLAPEAVRKMVWSIGRFVSNELTRNVDLDRTVTATAAAGGLPVVHYQHVIYPREVWLWVDLATSDLAMQRLVWELQYSLERAGLPCRQAYFRELPDPLTWEEGQSFSPLSLEGHRQGALVVVLTAGEGIALAGDLPPEQAELTQVLRALSDWPHLAFVDVSDGKFGLTGLLQGYGNAAWLRNRCRNFSALRRLMSCVANASCCR